MLTDIAPALRLALISAVRFGQAVMTAISVMCSHALHSNILLLLAKVKTPLTPEKSKLSVHFLLQVLFHMHQHGDVKYKQCSEKLSEGKH